MTILSRYLILSVGLTSLGGVLVFVFLLITGNALRDIIGLLAQGTLPFSLFWHLLGLLIPYAVSFAMPLGVLIAILLVMGRMSANREIIALRSAGIGLFRIAAPVLFVALAGTGLTAYINAVHAPEARASYKAILNDLVRTDPLRFIVPQTFVHDFPGYVLYVQEKEEDRLKGFWLWELDEERRAVRLLRAEEGGFTFDEKNDALVLTLREGFTELRDPDNPDNLREQQPTLSFRDARIRLPLSGILGEANRPRGLDHYGVRDLLKEREKALAEANAAASEDEREAALMRESQARYQLSRRFAMAASVLSLALFALPLGIRVGRTETYANFALALMIALGYYLALIMIGWAERSPHLRPDLLVWIPNLCAQLFGVVLLVRANRH